MDAPQMAIVYKRQNL